MKLVVLLLAICVCASANQAGVHLLVAQSGLEMVKDIVMPFVGNSIDSLTVPDISGTSDTAIGDIDYTLTNIIISNFDSETNLGIIPGTGLQVRATNVKLSVDMNWSYREKAWPHVKDSGTASFVVSSASVLVDVDAYLAGSTPKITFQNPKLTLEKFDLKVQGGASWIYNFFIKLFKSKIRQVIEQQVTQVILNTLTKQSDYFIQNFPFQQSFDNIVIVRFPMVQNPTFANVLVDIGLQGDAVSVSHPDRPYTGPVTPFTPPSEMSRMLSIIITDYTVNSLGYAFQQQGVFNWWFIPEDLPPDFPIKMNTKDWAFLFPTLANLYPNCEMGMEYEAKSSPRGKTTENGIGLQMSSLLTLYVVAYENETRINVLIADIEVELNAKVSTVGDVLIPRIEYVGTNLTFQNSSIPEIKSELPFLTQLIAFMLRKIIIPFANQKLENGFTLPVVPGTNLKDPLITYHNGYFAVNVNFSGRSDQSAQVLNRKGSQGNVIHINE